MKRGIALAGMILGALLAPVSGAYSQSADDSSTDQSLNISQDCQQIGGDVSILNLTNLCPDPEVVFESGGTVQEPKPSTLDCTSATSAMDSLQNLNNANLQTASIFLASNGKYFSQCGLPYNDLNAARKLLDKIHGAAKSSYAGNFVDFLTAVSQNKNFDAYTRYSASMDLVAISNNLTGAEKRKVLETVLNAMLGDRSEIIRMSAAAVLAYSNDKSIMTLVEYSYKNDPSIVVREASYRTLISLSNGSYQGPHALPYLSSVPVTPGTSALHSPMAKNSASMSATRYCLSDDEFGWLKSHVLILNSVIKLEDFKCQN